MNQKYLDQIFDSFVEEAVSGQGPPDLTARILTAWQEEKESPAKKSRLVAAELVEPTTSETPSNTTKPCGNLVKAALAEDIARENCADSSSSSVGEQSPAVQTTQPVSKSASSRIRNRRVANSRATWATVLSFAATILLVAFVWRAVVKPGADSSLTHNSDTELEGTSDTNEELRTKVGKDSAQENTDSSQGDTLPRLALDVPVNMQESQVMDLSNLPFDRDASRRADQPRKQSQNRDRVAAVPPKKIVEAVDLWMQRAWADAAIQPTERLDKLALAKKIYEKLLDKKLTDKTFASFAPPAKSFNPSQFSSQIVSNKLFAQNWSSRVTRQLLRNSSLPIDSDELNVVTALIRDQISSGSPWNELPSKLLTGDLSTPSASSVFVKALSKNDNHRLVQRIGASFLDANFGCVRCHDGMQLNPDSRLNSQANYWALVGMFKGIEAKGNGFAGKRLVSDKQQDLFAAKNPILYFETLDGNLRSVEAGLPGQSDWGRGTKQPREAVASWLAESDAFDRASVNQAWKLVFGQPLVNDSPLVPKPPQELELSLDFLAKQFRAHNRNMGSLVSWIVSSDAFARGPVNLTSSQWLSASEEELRKLQRSELLFASAPSLGSGNEAKNVLTSLAAVYQNANPLSELGNASTTLAQPDTRPLRPGKDRSGRNEIGVAMPPLAYVLHGERQQPEAIAFVQKLVECENLNWHARAAHVLEYSGQIEMNERFKKALDELLRSQNGNESDALHGLMWAVENALAS